MGNVSSEQFVDSVLTLIVGSVASYLWWRGRTERLFGELGYVFVATGMSLVLMGLLLDLANDFPASRKYVFAGDDPFTDKLRWYGGYALGGVFILVGFTQWVPINVSLRNTQRDLMKTNEALRNEMSERQRAESALASLQLRLLDLQEDKRRNVARELHDQFGQELTALKLNVYEEVGRFGDQDRPNAKREVEILDRLFSRVRDLSLRLRPLMLDDLGLIPAVDWLVKHHAQNTRLRVNFSHVGLEERLATRVENAVYRIAQEGLTNVVRHAQTSQATLVISVADGFLKVLVADQGVGFDPETVLYDMDTVGLPAMRECVEALGGTLTFEPVPGQGTALRANLPLDPTT